MAKAKEEHRTTFFVGKVYHWYRNKKGNLALHTGLGDKCRRKHYGTI